MDILPMLIQALAVSALSITIARAKIMAPLRERSKGKLRELLHCPYCLSHWVSFGIVGVVDIPHMGNTPYVDYPLYAFGLIGLSALITGGIFRLLLWQESRIEDLEKDLVRSNEIIRGLTEK